ncbi:MAG: ATPase domain-containing protein [Candidatus Bathyarchaeia archaeon]
MRSLNGVIPTGCRGLDSLLSGGFKSRCLYLVYGEAETGKTTLAIQLAVNAAKMNFKSIYIDPESSFSTERLSQISGLDLNSISPLILILRPENFMRQGYLIDHLHEYLTDKVGLIVFDTITSLYRVELGSRKETFTLNRELNRQVAFISDTVKNSHATALITTQVRQPISPNSVLGEVEPVATRVLSYWSDVIIRLKPSPRRGVVQAFVEKGFKDVTSNKLYLRICREGILDFKDHSNE